MQPGVDDTPFSGDFDGRIVYDLIYNPPLTRFLKEAAAAGCETIGGLGMLVAQAEDQFEWWTGRRPAAGLMRQAAMARLEKGPGSFFETKKEPGPFSEAV